MLEGNEQLMSPGPSVHTAGRLELLLTEAGKGGRGGRAGEGGAWTPGIGPVALRGSIRYLSGPMSRTLCS